MAGVPVFAPQMLRKDVRGEFIEAAMMPMGPQLVDQIATRMPSISDKENYAWLSETPIMEEFVDQMPIHALTDTGLTPESGADDPGYEVKNKTFAGALVFRRDDMADEKVGGYPQRVRDQVTLARSYPDVKLVAALEAGDTSTCYLKVGATAEYFFSATHAARGQQTATWSNLLTGTGTTVAQITADVGSGLKALYDMTGENTMPINRHLRSVFIVFPTAIEVNMRTAVKAAIVDSTSNVGFEPDIMLWREPLLTDTSDWYIGFNDPGAVRGMIWQDREGVMMEEVGEGSEMWTNLRQVEFAVTLRGAPAYGRPQRLVKINNS